MHQQDNGLSAASQGEASVQPTSFVAIDRRMFPDGGYEEPAGQSVSLELDGAARYQEPAAWLQVYQATAQPVRAVVREVAQRHAADLATRFYDELLNDVQASPLLSPDAVSGRLHSSLQAWIKALFNVQSEAEIPPVISLQFTVGEVHARIGVPVPIVLRGARVLKAGLAEYLHQEAVLGADELYAAVCYQGGLIDLAMEVMSAAYITSSKRAARTDEAYRLFSLGQDASMERERQRAALMEWTQSLLLDLYYTDRRSALRPLRSSEFGLWMYHKGRAIFDGMPEITPLMRIVGEVDTGVLPRLAAAAAQSEDERAVIEVLNQRMADVKFLLNALFDRIAAVDAGRDPLTQLLNRRFLPSVMAREVALATRTRATFGVLLIDVDYFKQVNDTYGHDGGDHVLRQTAELLQQVTRASDYLFRYGGEEFLALLVDVELDTLALSASRVRTAVAEHVFRLPDGKVLPITVSVGAALFDGHPDPDRMVNRADRALYAAKHRGRNRYVVDGGADILREGL